MRVAVPTRTNTHARRRTHTHTHTYLMRHGCPVRCAVVCYFWLGS
jgi:hypothetical protein